MDWDEKIKKALETYFDGFCDDHGDTACVMLEGRLRCTICGADCEGAINQQFNKASASLAC